MKEHRIRSIRLLVLTLCTAFIAACDQRAAIVNYTQVGACDGGPHRAWVFFEIGEIDNTKTDTDFNFKPLGVDLEAGVDPSVPWPRYNALMTDYFVGNKKAVPYRVLVPHGTSKSLLQYMVFDRWTSDPQAWKEANQTSYFVTYNRLAADPPVIMSKLNAQQTSWRETRDCNEIIPPNQNCTGCHRAPPLRSRTTTRQVPRGANVER